MKCSGSFLLASIALMGTLLAPATKADPQYKRTEVTFNQPTEIPGMVLLPGKYVMKLLDPYTDEKIVRFYNPQEDHMYAMVPVVLAYRMTPTDHTVITFEERAHDAPRAIKDWFPAGDHWGEEFVYPKAELLAASAAPTVSQPVQAKTTVSAPARTPQAKAVAIPSPATKAQPQQPVEIAQSYTARPPSTPVAPATEQKKELPKTASDLPLLALFGGLLLLAGSILRRRTV